MSAEKVEVGPEHSCGLPMSRNPHPDAGSPTMAGVDGGYTWECIPCLIATRNRVGAAWRAVQAAMALMERRYCAALLDQDPRVIQAVTSNYIRFRDEGIDPLPVRERTPDFDAS